MLVEYSVESGKMDFLNFDIEMSVDAMDQAGCVLLGDLSVSRRGRFITISYPCNVPTSTTGTATLVAVALDNIDSEPDILFGLLDKAPHSVEIKGRFSPADGYAYLRRTENGMSLRISGPHLHPIEVVRDGLEQCKILTPFFLHSDKVNWTVAARYIELTKAARTEAHCLAG